MQVNIFLISLILMFSKTFFHEKPITKVGRLFLMVTDMHNEYANICVYYIDKFGNLKNG